MRVHLILLLVIHSQLKDIVLGSGCIQFVVNFYMKYFDKYVHVKERKKEKRSESMTLEESLLSFNRAATINIKPD